MLELRIHGVSNTPPEAMLDLPGDSVEQVDGDDLGSFWRPTDQALESLTPADRGYVPPGITREAYSWGGLARTSIGGTSAVGTVLNVAGRFGWSLLLPFGLVNVAYWSRRLMRPGAAPANAAPTNAAPGDTGPDQARPLDWRNRAGGGALRLAGLLMTLLTATTAGVISLDFLAVQCFSSTTARCSGLPSWAGFLYGWSLSRRLALLSLVPVVLVLFLWFLAHRSRTRYERATRDQMYGEGPDEQRTPDASQARPGWPLLSTPGFWNHSVVSSSTATLHACAVALLVTVATAWHLHFGGGSDCRTVGSLLGPACRAQAAQGSALGGSLVMVGIALAVLALVVVLVLVRTDDAADIEGPDRATLNPLQRLLRDDRTTRRVALLCAAVFAVQLVLMYAADFSFPSPAAGALTAGTTRVYLVGLGAAVLVELALLLGLAMAALTWRFIAAPWPIATGLVFALTLLVAGVVEPGPARWALRTVAAVALLATVLPVFFVDRGQDGPRRRYQMWGGCAPGVLLLLATLLCLTIASAVVLLAGNLLNGNLPPASLAGLAQSPTQAVGAGCEQQCDPHTDFPLTAPRPYVWFGALLLVALVLCLIVVLLAVWLQARRPSPQPIEVERGSTRGPVVARNLRGGHATDSVPGGALARAVGAARAFARHAHRAEKAVALLTYAATVALAGSLSVTASGSGGGGAGAVGSALTAPGTTAYDVVTALMGWGMWVLILVGAGVVALATGTGAGAGQRPLGLMWDLICFLPRAGHPFGPPCYAERVVPELLGRYRWWLTHEGTRPDDQVATSPRRIVLSAHSLGGVLATATVLAATEPGDGRSPLPRLSLLTYGTQLRAYFARLFPELLGPDVLGSPPCRAADGTTFDPWASERRETLVPGGKPPLVVRPGSVRAHLGGSATGPGRWLSLWHLTDPLGFPVHLYPPVPRDTDFDRYAEEVDRTAYLLTPLAHSDYPRTGAYDRALAELTGLPPGAPGGPSPAPGGRLPAPGGATAAR